MNLAILDSSPNQFLRANKRQHFTDKIQAVTGQPPVLTWSTVVPCVVTFPSGKASTDKLSQSDIESSEGVILSLVNGRCLTQLLTTFQERQSEILQGNRLNLSSLASRGPFSDSLRFTPNVDTATVTARESHPDLTCIDLRDNQFKSLDEWRSMPRWFPGLQSLLCNLPPASPLGQIAHLIRADEPDVIIGSFH
jgi:hypothetical protein